MQSKRAYKAAWYQANKARLMEEAREERAAQTPEQKAAHAAYMQAWYEANKTRIAELARKRNLARTPERKAERAAYMQAYFEANRDQFREYGRKRRAEKAGEVRAYMQAWKEANADKVKASRERNRDKILARKAAYRAANRGNLSEKERARNEAKAVAALGRARPEICDSCSGPGILHRSGKLRIVFDHCHTTGRARGWICNSCNSALGLLRDSAPRLLALVAYLNRTPALGSASNARTLTARERLLGRARPEKCEACGGNEGGIKFDHCHTRDQARGWLCDRCNLALGFMGDSAPRLLQLVAYLERTNKRAKVQHSLF